MYPLLQIPMAEGFFNPNFCCPICGRLHAIRQCSRFVVMDVEQKLRVVAQHSLCYNCLAQSHRLAECESIDRCYRCRQDHHSWLHPLPKGSIWFPMTAYIRVFTSPNGSEQYTRAIIDPTAARSSITLREAEELRCRVKQGRTTLTVSHSHKAGRTIVAEFVVEAKTYADSPEVDIQRPTEYPRSEVADLVNANKYWHRRLECCMVLGADLASRILIGPAKGRPGRVYAQDTIFGLAFFGEGVRAE